MPSRKSIWSEWDKAWDLGLTPDQRMGHLKNATAPSFVYSNMTDIVTDGKLDELIKLIEKVLGESDNKITVKHLGWWEHHHHSALQWDMVNVETGKQVITGWSHAAYDEEGRLVEVTDFY